VLWRLGVMCIEMYWYTFSWVFVVCSYHNFLADLSCRIIDFDCIITCDSINNFANNS